ncbi:YkvA family protein [Saccharospirillum mangrovi]|uniref:YkvA family protein n=1 Tax=Saccharospirillum mangrovi TaxID=2161747 RepID=UPI000D33966C|nr:YkvA family protein [Saccharospirillum mangrovi]
MLQKLKQFATAMKTRLVVLYLAVRDTRTPWYVRALGLGVVAYALSPIDLIPDFIPVIGWLDDLILVPIGLWLVDRMIPDQVRLECTERAAEVGPISASKTAGVIILVLWVAAAAWLVDFVMRRF